MTGREKHLKLIKVSTIINAVPADSFVEGGEGREAYLLANRIRKVAIALAEADMGDNRSLLCCIHQGLAPLITAAGSFVLYFVENEGKASFPYNKKSVDSKYYAPFTKPIIK